MGRLRRKVGSTGLQHGVGLPQPGTTEPAGPLLHTSHCRAKVRRSEERRMKEWEEGRYEENNKGIERETRRVGARKGRR